MPTRLLVLGLANAAYPQTLADAFAAQGLVRYVEVQAGQRAEAAGATAVVEMADVAGARAAAAALDGNALLGHVVRVAITEGRPPAGAHSLYWSPAVRAEVESREHRGPRPGDFGHQGGRRRGLVAAAASPIASP